MAWEFDARRAARDGRDLGEGVGFGRELTASTAASFMATADEVRKAESTSPRSSIVLHVDLKTQNVNRALLVRARR